MKSQKQGFNGGYFTLEEILHFFSWLQLEQFPKCTGIVSEIREVDTNQEECHTIYSVYIICVCRYVIIIYNIYIYMLCYVSMYITNESQPKQWITKAVSMQTLSLHIVQFGQFYSFTGFSATSLYVVYNTSQVRLSAKKKNELVYAHVFCYYYM